MKPRQSPSFESETHFSTPPFAEPSPGSELRGRWRPAPCPPPRQGPAFSAPRRLSWRSARTAPGRKASEQCIWDEGGVGASSSAPPPAAGGHRLSKRRRRRHHRRWWLVGEVRRGCEHLSTAKPWGRPTLAAGFPGAGPGGSARVERAVGTNLQERPGRGVGGRRRPRSRSRPSEPDRKSQDPTAQTGSDPTDYPGGGRETPSRLGTARPMGGC